MLTGTPIQNQVLDLYPLVRMVGVVPFDDVRFFKNRIISPLKSGHPDGINNLRTLVGSITLRRVKGLEVKDRTSGLHRPLVSLPTKTVRIARVKLSDSERELYDRLFGQSRDRARALLAEAGHRETFQLLQLLARLRLLCCDHRLLPGSVIAAVGRGENVVDPAKLLERAKHEVGTERVAEMLAKLTEVADDECVICLDGTADVVTRCGHCFHRKCISTYIDKAPNAGCPLCRQPVKQTDLLEAVRPPIDEPELAGQASIQPTPEVSGAKIKVLLEMLTGLGPNDKVRNAWLVVVAL